MDGFSQIVDGSMIAFFQASGCLRLIAAGPQVGRATMRLHDPLLAVGASGARTKPFTAARDGISLNCAVGCEVHERAKLERLCRYMARSPIA
jgi:hypothetical protein